MESSLNIPAWLVVSGLLVFFLIFAQLLNKTRSGKLSGDDPATGLDEKRRGSLTGDGPIVPLANFDWSTTPPQRYRPFLTNTHVAMGIQKCNHNDWILIDNGYLKRLAERAGTVRAHAEEAIGWNANSKHAVEELYSRLIDHLPKRFPTMFKRERSVLRNLVTRISYDIDSFQQQPADMLRTLSENVEEDFYLMCPDERNEFRLQAFLGTFPGGFRPLDRAGHSVRELHQAVPGYESRIGSGVDRFFQRMKGNELIQRFNWSLQIDGPDLFRLDGNNFYPERGMELPEEANRIDLKQCYLRVERQSLICLPESRAIVFCVRSYMTELSKIKEEGNGPALAEAIESMPEKLGDYKKRPFWAHDLNRYLRSV